MSPAAIILERLTELRRKLSAWLVVDGLSRVLAVVYIAAIAGPPSGFGWVSLAVTILLGLLLAQQVYQHGRDVRTAPVEIEDDLLRKFQRAEFVFVMQNHYLQVGRKIFNVEARDYILVEEGQRVRVRYFPHSLKVVWAGRV